MAQRRWPPAYDFETLVKQINKIAQASEFVRGFYEQIEPLQPEFCQGDIIKFKSDFPLIDADGDISILSNPVKLWVLVGNTCDFTRDETHVRYSQISPLTKLDANTPAKIISGLKTYSTYKRFYMPEWQKNTTSYGYVIDFSKFCSIDKKALKTQAQVLARLSQESWYLFHSCLVRFLARDDGRNEPD